MNENKFSKIDALNKELEQITPLVKSSLEGLENLELYAQQQAQKIVDDLCTRISAEINFKLANKRQDLIKFLKQSYISANEIIETFEPLINLNIADLSSVIDAVKKIIAIYEKPYKTAVEFVTVLTPKLVTLTNNISELSNIKISINKPSGIDVNFDKLDIKMDPITIEDITA